MSINIMTNIYLHGMLGRKFGKLWTLEVKSVAEAVRAIDINLKGKLREYWIGKGKAKKYQVKIGDYSITDEIELTKPSGKGDIHIIPITKGSGGVVKMIVGAVLIIVGAVYGQGWMIKLGAGLMLGGAIELLTPVPNFSQNAGNDGSGNTSTLFQGNAMAVLQGVSVPIVYGRALVAPMPICLSLVSHDRAGSIPSASTGCVDVVDLDGHGQQYSSGEC